MSRLACCCCSCVRSISFSSSSSRLLPLLDSSALTCAVSSSTCTAHHRVHTLRCAVLSGWGFPLFAHPAACRTRPHVRQANRQSWGITCARGARCAAPGQPEARHVHPQRDAAKHAHPQPQARPMAQGHKRSGRYGHTRPRKAVAKRRLGRQIHPRRPKPPLAKLNNKPPGIAHAFAMPA